MKKRICVSFLILVLCAALFSCGKGDFKKTTSFKFPVSFTIIEDGTLSEDVTLITVEGCSAIYVSDENGKNVSLDLGAFGISFSDLIPGDALEIEYVDNGEDVLIAETMPGTLYINSEVKSVKHIKAKIHEVKLKKNGGEISLEAVGEDIDFAQKNFGAYFAITKENGKMKKKDFSEYESGTTLYYACAEGLSDNLVSLYTYFYDYNPQNK